MPGWEQIALAAAGGSGGGGGVAVSLDINQLITPIASNINDRLTEDFTVTRPTPTSVYPASWTQDVFNQILEADNAQVRWGDNLEWNMAEDTYLPGDEMNYKLVCNFQTVYLPAPAEDSGLVCTADGLWLLHNVQPFAEVSETGWGWRVHIDISFGSPYPSGNGVVGIPVHYNVTAREGDGDLHRQVTRSFAILGDGTKQQI